jgi:hypothetical protein
MGKLIKSYLFLTDFCFILKLRIILNSPICGKESDEIEGWDGGVSL